MHGAKSGAPIGNQNAIKHGVYSAEAIERQRAIVGLIRSTNEMEARLLAQ